MNGRGREVVDLIYKVSTEDRACKQTPTLYALAICARSNDPKTKAAAYKILSSVCRIPTHLFEFVKYCEKETDGTGWGRSQRVAIGKWYNEKEPKELAYLVTKYKKRRGWSHRDVVRLAHVKSENRKIKMVLKYVVTNMESTNQEYTFDKSEEDVKVFLEGVEAAKKCTTKEDIGKLRELIATHELVREHVPTKLLASKDIWDLLFRTMPMMAMLRSLGKMSSLELLKSESFEEGLVVEKLRNMDILKSARIHPFSLLVALMQYKTGHGNKGKLSWAVNTTVTEALEKAFYKAFQFVTPTNKRYLLAVDDSMFMRKSSVIGSSNITAFEASLAMVLLTARTEATCEVITFSRKYTNLDIKKDDTLDSVLKKCDGLERMERSDTDLSMPMKYAKEHNKNFDVFIVYTDLDTSRSIIPPAKELRKYREYAEIDDARLIVVGMVSNGFTVADPDDPFMMDIVGFDTEAPKAMMNFVNGMI
jgi:60 kDa SS-A/Ro ribonucleoprotein